MSQVYRRLEHTAFPLGPFLRAAGLHVGAAAAAASLRRELTERTLLTGSEFDEAYAVARFTPGTNLLALYTLVGERLAGWRGATLALSIGTFIPAALATVVAVGYVAYAGNPLAARAMQSARAGALAVLLWAAVRLIRPQLTQQRTRGLTVAVAALALSFAFTVPQIVLLLLGGGAGAWLLRRES